MPFGIRSVGAVEIDFHDVFQRLIIPALRSNGWQTVRMDYWGADNALVSKALQKILAAAPFAIFDITAASPTVLYNLGYRHAFKRGLTLLMHRSGAGTPPYTLASQRYLTYSARLGEADLAGLTGRISELLAEERATNPKPEEVDIFISYKSEQRDVVANLAAALREESFSVWWDPHPQTNSESYSDQIFNALASAKAVVVCWSREALSSKWVVGEANIGLEQKKLVQARLDTVQPRPPFNVLQSADLSGNPIDGNELRKIIVAVRELVNNARLGDA